MSFAGVVFDTDATLLAHRVQLGLRCAVATSARQVTEETNLARAGLREGLAGYSATG